MKNNIDVIEIIHNSTTKENNTIGVICTKGRWKELRDFILNVIFPRLIKVNNLYKIGLTNDSVIMWISPENIEIDVRAMGFDEVYKDAHIPISLMSYDIVESCIMKKKVVETPNRKKIADEFLQTWDKYLTGAGWLLDEYTLMRIDPITKCKHHTMTAINIQLDRDLQRK